MWLQLAECDSLLQNDSAFFITDLHADGGVVLGPVNEDVAVVDIKEGQARAIRIDFIGKADSGFCHIAAGCVQAAAGDFMEWIADVERISGW